MPIASMRLAIVEALPMVMQVPGRSRHARFGRQEIAERHLAGAHCFAEFPDVGSGANVPATEFAIEHRAARHHEGRQVDARGAHQLSGRGLVAAAEEHDRIDRIAAN